MKMSRSERLFELEEKIDSLEERAEVLGLDADAEWELLELEAEYNRLREEEADAVHSH